MKTRRRMERAESVSRYSRLPASADAWCSACGHPAVLSAHGLLCPAGCGEDGFTGPYFVSCTRQAVVLRGGKHSAFFPLGMLGVRRSRSKSDQQTRWAAMDSVLDLLETE